MDATASVKKAESEGGSALWNLLFVEDEPILRLTCVDAAQVSGHTARAAQNAVEGLRMFYEQRPDAIVTDLLMPGMNGFELISLLRKSAPDIPIVVLTAVATEQTKLRAMDAGATRYLVKPVSALDLIGLLSEMLNQDGVV